MQCGPQGKINAGCLDRVGGSWLEASEKKMNIEQSELEPEMVPIVDRCFKGCGTRAVLSDGFSRFCAKCALAILKGEVTQLPGLAA